jgi:hypothetical protein
MSNDQIESKPAYDEKKWREVTRDDFFATVGQLNVHPRIISDGFPYTQDWNTPAGFIRGKSVDYILKGERLYRTQYLVPI